MMRRWIALVAASIALGCDGRSDTSPGAGGTTSQGGTAAATSQGGTAATTSQGGTAATTSQGGTAATTSQGGTAATTSQGGTAPGGAAANGGAGGASGGTVGASGGSAAGGVVTHRFERIVLHTEFYSEGIASGDFDKDGDLDVTSGPYWYEGPAFTARHSVYAGAPIDPTGFSDSFLQFSSDLNSDGYADIIVIGFPGQDARWYENPRSADAPWPVHLAFQGVDEESPTFIDITGDGKPELVCAHAGKLGWATPDSANPNALWPFHPLSPDLGIPTFSHGLGVTDVDADGRPDVVEATRWWKQPGVLVEGTTWPRREQNFGPGGAQIYAYDIDGDNDHDIVTTWAAHGYGLSWFERTGAETYVEHPFAPKDPSDTQAGPLIYEPHALAAHDIDRDGLLDLVTGRRFWAHVPEPRIFDEPSPLYWFQLQRAAGGPQFIPHLIDNNSGVGLHVEVADLNADGLPDIYTANKRGAFVFLHRTE